ncbi:MAG: SUF system NifU family Fe-S cluster assembly protein [Parcubacteria group bacterium]
MNSLSEDLYQETILDHASRPRHAHPLEGSQQTHAYNPLCGDSLTVFARAIGQRQGLHEIACVAHGCVLSKASASLMAATTQKKSKAEILELCDQVQRMVTGLHAIPTNATLESLQPLASVARYPARIKCVMLPWHALKKLLSNTAAQ